MTQEAKFLNALEDVFVGAPVEGGSDYINLMQVCLNVIGQRPTNLILRNLASGIPQNVSPCTRSLLRKCRRLRRGSAADAPGPDIFRRILYSTVGNFAGRYHSLAHSGLRSLDATKAALLRCVIDPL